MKKLLLILLIVNCSFPIVKSQWTKQTLPVNKNISGIKFIDSLRGWACTNISVLGDTSFIINTTNGGTSWNIQHAAPGTFFNSISVINSGRIFVGGYDGVNNIYMLLRSTNAGLNWVNLNPPSVPSDMFFINQDSGWYCDDFGGADVRTTTNGGATWQLRNSGLTDNIKRIFFLNYSTGYCGSSYLKKTTDAGLNWVQVHDFATERVYGVFFLNEQTGWVGLSGAKIGKTTNGGLNWTIQQPNNMISNNTTDVYMLNDTGWAGTGWLYKIFKTINGGLNWGYQSDTSGSIRISVIDSKLAWSGSIGIAKTTNGGGPIFYLGFTSSGNEVPRNFTLYQNYPNPFNPYTTIKLDVSESMPVTLFISDALGRVKYEIVNQQLSPGVYSFNWDSREYASGVYFYTLVSKNYRESRKMLLIK